MYDMHSTSIINGSSAGEYKQGCMHTTLLAFMQTVWTVAGGGGRGGVYKHQAPGPQRSR